MSSGAPPASTAGARKLSTEVGARVRRERTDAGWSLGAFAAATGLGKGTLSELERGQRNPTLDTLFAIATVLAVPLSQFLAPSDDLPASENDSHGSPAGAAMHAVLLDRWTDAEVTHEVYRVRLTTIQYTAAAHNDGVRETVTVLSGSALVGSVDSPVHVPTGGSHAFEGSTAHVYVGVGTDAVALLSMSYPHHSGTEQPARPGCNPQL